MGTRIDTMNPIATASRLHVIPAMKDGVSGKLTVGQLLDLLIDAAPGTMDTLNELAAALGDDPNFAATITALIATKASSASVTAGLALKQDKADLSFGQCRLVLSGGNLVLSRVNGKLLSINGAPKIIPAAGLSLAATGLTPGTTYYLYAHDDNADGTVDAIEASATTYAIDAATGVAIKTGDATRTLVGMARPITGPAWVDSDAQRFVLSWFNRRTVRARNSVSTNATTGSTSYVEPYASNRAEFLCWAGVVSFDLIACHFNTAGVNALQAGVGIDGTSTVVAQARAASPGVSYEVSLTASDDAVLTEGYHYGTMLAKTSAGTSTIYGVGNTQVVVAEFMG